MPARRGSAVLTGLVASVDSFEDDETLDGTPVTYYLINCKREGMAWETKRRYNDFHTLNEGVASQIEMRTMFPQKTLGAPSEDQKAQRREALDQWVHELLTQKVSASLLAQLHRFFEVNSHMDDLYDAGGAMRRHAPGRARHQGYITKLGGNKDDPYNQSKGTWKKRFMVLQDDLRYYLDDETYEKGGAPKGEVSLDQFIVTSDPGSCMFIVHACPWPLICKTESPQETEEWVLALTNFANEGF